ncbi:hypothetical protein M2271_000270 [Streptomyces sp. LBL]|uniref:hypothetical protein n=1 Tax=Streptomyces sp. LBL TaxID=2940562 RepID=UPI0024743054|nr:hypothetical protein [Streptomyces sp. LBL]MDH6622483.1 hypothetical protein [Streptomyces sp. LBL]
MRSTRTFLAIAAASAVLAIATPGAYAGDSDWDHEESSYGKEDSSYSKEHDKDSSHDAPHGGMHTGGGALTAVSDGEWGAAKDPKYDPETYKDEGYEKDKKDGYEKESYGDDHEKSEKGEKGSYGDHEKPSGGMHTGGGALASPGMTAGGLAVLGVAATGLYAARRNRSAASTA